MDPLSPGTRPGRYEIRSKIGAGGMGEVYLAQDTELHHTAAIKTAKSEEELSHLIQSIDLRRRNAWR